MGARKQWPPCIVRMTVARQRVDGQELWNGELGVTFVVDLAQQRPANWTVTTDPSFKRKITLVPDVLAGGWIPLDILEIR